jgi:hypothetical protein
MMHHFINRLVIITLVYHKHYNIRGRMKLYYGFFLTFLAVFSPRMVQGAFQQAYQTTSSNQSQAAPQLHGQQQTVQRPQQPLLQQIPQQVIQPITQVNNYQQRQTLFHAPQVMLRGAIKINDDHGKIPEFRIYFDGKQTTNNAEGFFSIPVDEGALHACSLLISKGLKQNFEKTNTIKNLVLFTSKDYKFYSLNKKEDHTLSWEEKDLGKEKDFILPQKTLTIILDPLLIDRLESWNIALPGNTIILPRIVLKANAQAAIKDASARSLLGGTMNLGSFHEPVKHKTQHFVKGTCSLTQ